MFIQYKSQRRKASAALPRALSISAVNDGVLRAMPDKCFVSVAKRTIVDVIGATGKGEYSRKSFEELKIQYPDLQIHWRDTAMKVIEDQYVTDPVEITADDYTEALDCMPPTQWITRSGVESFRFTERIYGCVTTIYARAGDRYFKFDDRLLIMHDEVVAKVKKACGLEAEKA